MTLYEWFKSMLSVTPAEPRGWFRWLHNHYMGRYGDHHLGLVIGNTFTDAWKRTKIELDEQQDELDQDLALSFVSLHPWACGVKKHTKLVAALWEQMTPEARGAFMAGLSEFHFGDGPELIDKTLLRLETAELSPESLCQLACNAVRFKRLDFLTALFAKYPSPTFEINRFSASSSRESWESEELTKLSHRVIDMILEAALIANYADAAKLALQHGADPNIPVWQLERSSNHKYSALGYVIASEHMQDMKPHKEMTELLLDHGATGTLIRDVTCINEEATNV